MLIRKISLPLKHKTDRYMMKTQDGLLNVWKDNGSQETVENEHGEQVQLAPAYFYYGIYIMEMHPRHGTRVHGIAFEMSPDWNAGFYHMKVPSALISTELLHRAIHGFTATWVIGKGLQIVHRN